MMDSRRGFRRAVSIVSALTALGGVAAGCLDRPVSAPETKLTSAVQLPVTNNTVDQVDILFEIDNSNSMRDNQVNLARNFGVLIDQLVNPPVDPMTMRRRYPPVKSMHVGVISSDLGTPGSMVPSCANSDVGDDGILNPIRNGAAIRSHQPWTTAPPNVRPMRCENRADQYPNFLDFNADTTDAMVFRDDFVCNAFLSVGGCGLEQQLESAYRALVIRNARAGVAGNMDPNAGFVREGAVLAIVLVTDEEDGSTRDCRYAEPGDPDGICRAGGRGAALDVFDSTNPNWSSADLNLRFYMYTPGGQQDPTWPLNRYIDPTRPNRGFTSLKPGRPDLVIFASIAGVPINLPQIAGSTDATDPANIDWNTLLGRNPDGSDGYVGMSTEGPISMRQRNPDMNCATRVVPACRREGSTYAPDACDTTRQYFAWPSRRIAEVARRFAVTYQNGAISSICKNDYSDALRQIVQRIQNRLAGRCLPRVLDTTPRLCCDAMGQPAGCVPAAQANRDGGVACVPATPTTTVQVNCVVRESLPNTVRASDWCVPARGRRAGGRDGNNLETCLVNQLPVTIGQRPTSGEGFFYDTTRDEGADACPQRISFTSNAGLAPGASAIIEWVQSQN